MSLFASYWESNLFAAKAVIWIGHMAPVKEVDSCAQPSCRTVERAIWKYANKILCILIMCSQSRYFFLIFGK